MYVYTIIKTHVIIRTNTNMIDQKQKSIITHINVCIHKYKYSYNCMYKIQL